MKLHSLQVIAGTVSSMIFVTSNLPMLWKAFATKNLKSYSLGHIGLSNCGNLIFWLYLAGLPLGPIWFLHGFNTFAAGLMLLWYLRYERPWRHFRIKFGYPGRMETSAPPTA